MSHIKIPVSTLRPGMYIVDPGISWLKAPLLYMQEGILASDDEINGIILQGFAEAYYDPERSRDENSAAPQPNTPLAVELQAANRIYEDAYENVKNFLESARGGALDLTFARPLVGDIIKSLSRNVDALVTLSLLKKTDEYTYAHSVNVTIFAVAFANFLGMPDDRLHNVGLAGLLHDYGKALIPKEILTAPRSLTFQEFEVMRSHVLLGVEKIKQFSSVEQEAIEGIAQHHEKHNGTGYPNRLSGKQIGVFGRILSLSDVYDALSSKRVYKGALAPNKALGMMYKMRGQAWAPGYVERFIKMVGIFPVGTAVELSNEHQGIVCRSNPNFPAQPCVLVARDPDGRAIQPQFVDLTRYIGLRITRSLSAAEATHFDIPMLLGGPA
ncbi:MAG: HD-GYP domain-containing protein [Desulfovibrio sp.]